MKHSTRKLILLRLCTAIVGGMGVVLLLNPSFAIQQLFGGGLSGDIAMARGTGIVLLVLCFRCWPNRDGIDRRPLLALLAYFFLATLFLGYLKLEAGFVSTTLLSVLVLHLVIVLLLAGLAYQEGSITNTKSRRSAPI